LLACSLACAIAMAQLLVGGLVRRFLSQIRILGILYWS
jgi:hypothetical protein